MTASCCGVSFQCRIGEGGGVEGRLLVDRGAVVTGDDPEVGTEFLVDKGISRLPGVYPEVPVVVAVQWRGEA